MTVLYKHRPDSVQGLGVMLLYEKEQAAKTAYIGDMLFHMVSAMYAFGGVKEMPFKPFSVLFHKQHKKGDNRSADQIITGLCERLKRIKDKKKGDEK